MTRRDQLQEQYEEALFALLMDELAIAEGKKALCENEQLRHNPKAALPEHTERRCIKTIHRHFSIKATRTLGRVTMKVINRVAVFALVGTLLFATAFAASDNFRINTLNFVINVFDDRAIFHSDVGFSEMPQNVAVGWLPQGYELFEYNQERVDVDILYQTPDGKELKISIFDAGGSRTVDTENAEVGTVMINGYEAVTIFKTGVDGFGDAYAHSQVVWVDTEHGWFIEVKSYQENIETLLQVAEKLQLG